jgi:hypothetical protein
LKFGLGLVHVQGDAGHPGLHGGGPNSIIVKNGRGEEQERHKGLLTPKKRLDSFTCARSLRFGLGLLHVQGDAGHPC